MITASSFGGAGVGATALAVAFGLAAATGRTVAAGVADERVPRVESTW